MSSGVKVGLALGGGGVLGGSWRVGSLHALATATGWDPASADIVVGTSAGSMIGSLLATGVPPWFMVATATGRYRETIAAAGVTAPPEASGDGTKARPRSG